MIQSHHVLEDRGHQIYYGQMSQDDTIPLHSQRPRSSDHFRESNQGWYNRTMFSRTEVTRSIMDRCPRMIQSPSILKDWGLWITLGKMPRDGTIPLQHHYSPFRGRSFPNNTKLVSKVFKLYSRQRLHWYIIIQTIIIYIFNIWILIYHHLYL